MKKFKYLLLAMSCILSTSVLAADPQFEKDAKVEIKDNPPQWYGLEGDKIYLTKVHIVGNDLVFEHVHEGPLSSYNPREWDEELHAIVNRRFCGKPYLKKHPVKVIFNFLMRPDKKDKSKDVLKTISVSTETDCDKK